MKRSLLFFSSFLLGLIGVGIGVVLVAGDALPQREIVQRATRSSPCAWVKGVWECSGQKRGLVLPSETPSPLTLFPSPSGSPSSDDSCDIVCIIIVVIIVIIALCTCLFLWRLKKARTAGLKDLPEISLLDGQEATQRAAEAAAAEKAAAAQAAEQKPEGDTGGDAGGDGEKDLGGDGDGDAEGDGDEGEGDGDEDGGSADGSTIAVETDVDANLTEDFDLTEPNSENP
mmetsp:Transcript_9825/g.14865  ORF Transcript_9825/g.14865 Transcript_9825/m.14865 type:complete len:229 (-) Transcript_9825:230-916(-)|eukprot:CAMPEP_0201506326 /NCGR_PEP_ID=MMETSP0161_2-20130828/251_1 /ASSEMBLY_ACC=CAM_ASM_000251 /TAXON_ID=180227 /ORGANISM="Neoparamoeba aestuarina, Strain SoJaBio B1-5/56/2" /LENGTH=228 /DNA_ID=CAMNT_0047900387 /DNA_START=103 /DNA_END=789 /DNA_ORIENTATION=+